MKKINICSIGEPTNPRTWSGTPYSLYIELKKIDRIGSAFNSSATLSKLKKIAVKLLARAYYSNSVETQRGIFNRYLNAKKVVRETNKSNTNLTLHTGTLDLPFPKMPHNQKHYLYCDSTWNLWSTYSTYMKGYTKKLIRDGEKLERESYRQMEHIFSISEYVKDNLVNHYGVSPDKVTVVGTGLGVIKPYFGPKDYSNNQILFVAKNRFEDKGGPLVLEAFKIAVERNPNLKLMIIGQNEYTEKINLPNVKTFGYIPIEDLQNLFNESSLFLMPAINEAWGLVYLEALAARMPIVGLNRYSFPEISGNGAYGFGLNDADHVKLSEILINAFSDSGKLEEMGTKGQEHCLNNFTWSNAVSKIVNTIDQKI